MSANARKLWAMKLSGKSTESAMRVSSKKKSDIGAVLSTYTGAKFEGVILGIDPSLRGTGLSIISVKNGELFYIDSRTVKNKPSLSFAECLGEIFRNTDYFVRKYKPICAALESSVYVQNFRTAMILGSSRGAAIAAVAAAGLKAFEYPPLRIKQAVIGYGRASKEQISSSIHALISNAPILPFDEADASAAALTHIFTYRE